MNAVDLAYEMVEAFDATGYPYASPQVLLAATDHNTAYLLVEVWDDKAQRILLIGVTDNDARLARAQQYAVEVARDSEYGALCYGLSPSGWTAEVVEVEGVRYV